MRTEVKEKARKKLRATGTVKLFLASLIVLAGVVLIFSAFYVPPTGVIDQSVLLAFGEILTFAGALIGIDYTYQYRVFKIQSEVRKLVREELSVDKQEEAEA